MAMRLELQRLAKQHGIKANMKNSEMEAALLELGVVVEKKKGLSVRDLNEMEDASLQPAREKPASKAKPLPRQSLSLFFDEHENNAENCSVRANKPPRKSLTVAVPTYRIATRRSTEKMLQEQALLNASSVSNGEVEEADDLLAQQEAIEAIQAQKRAQQEAEAATAAAEWKAQEVLAATLLAEEEAAAEEAHRRQQLAKANHHRLLRRLNKLHASLELQSDLIQLLHLTRQQRLVYQDNDAVMVVD
ncbi:hypothetical protein BASA81_007772 [Batrachochytrium salamandrivorans]|nr:hypothetical protein BASA81_007772 [Batrachochytrium salamandrivorans]